jgi:hypothetical protein
LPVVSVLVDERNVGVLWVLFGEKMLVLGDVDEAMMVVCLVDPSVNLAVQLSDLSPVEAE